MNPSPWTVDFDMDIIVQPVIPTAPKTLRILHALQRGERLTGATAINQYGVLALSQECGRLRNKYHWPVQDRFIESSPGVHVKEYWI